MGCVGLGWSGHGLRWPSAILDLVYGDHVMGRSWAILDMGRPGHGLELPWSMPAKV
jgi:hypothetical protein